MKFFKEIKNKTNESRFDRRDAYQRDYDSSVSNMGRPADHRGLGQELAHETNNIAISINGKTWKVVPGRGYADSKEEWSYLNGMKAWAEKKSAATGKKWSVSLTGAPVSESTELKKQKRLYNQAAKDANIDQVGAGKKIDTMKNSLRHKDVVKKKELEESSEDLPMYGAIIHRIMVAHPDLLAKYGPEKIMAAAEDEAEWVGDVEEIGSSDVSISVKRVMQSLEEQHGVTEGVAESLPLNDALKVLRQYGADHFKTGAESLNFYKGGKPYTLDLTWNDDTTRSVSLGELNHVVRTLKAQDNKFNFNPNDSWSQDFETRMSESENPEDVICVDVPLFIRLMEYAREDARTDMDLHNVAENLIRLCSGGNTMTMMNYDSIIPSDDVKEPTVTEATGNQGYDNMLAVMKAVDASQDAHFDLAGEPITLEYPEARFLAGKYKAFLRAGRQEEFLSYMNDPVMFDRLMLQLRKLIDKQKNFKGSVPGERDVPEAYSMDDVRKDAETQIKKDLDAQSDARINKARNQDEEPFMAKVGRKIVGGVAGGVKGAWKGFTESAPPNFPQDLEKKLLAQYKDEPEKAYATMWTIHNKKKNESTEALPQVDEGYYWCSIDKTAKLIPEGYKKLANGYLTRK